jgi:hypothetical protein
MSRLTFNGNTHQISLIDNKGRTVGTWAAYNNVDSHATLNYVNNGTYNIQDTTTPHRHRADPNGPYGSHGIVSVKNATEAHGDFERSEPISSLPARGGWEGRVHLPA